MWPCGREAGYSRCSGGYLQRHAVVPPDSNPQGHRWHGGITPDERRPDTVPPGSSCPLALSAARLAGGASVLSGIFCTPPVSSVLGPVELDPTGDPGACQPRKGVDLSGVALVGSFFNEKRAFFGGIDFIGGDNAGGFPDFYL